MRVAINGLGRIGRCALRAIIEQKREDIEVVAINSPGDIQAITHLLQYDSIHGRFGRKIKLEDDTIDVGRGPIKLLRERDPLRLPWHELKIDLVLECSGKFNKRADAGMHIEAGAGRVLVSAPSADADVTLVWGVNNQALAAKHTVVSVGSCTTNALAPIAKVLHDAATIENGFMTTIHAYTGDQRLVDNSHKDLRRARAAALSMIPTSTGAAQAIGLVLPELAGKLSGTAIRVPVPNVSMVDLTVMMKKTISRDEIHEAMREAAKGDMKNILGICDEPLVSTDFTHSTFSSVFDEDGTYVSGKLVRVSAWYDNEWGFTTRMLDVAEHMGQLGG